MKLILASASPRRADLLRQAGIPFAVIEPTVSEQLEERLSPEELVSVLARRKAMDVAGRVGSGYILAADTIVLYRGLILGKPADAEEAGRMLKLISGDRHEVITGLILLDAATGRLESGVSSTGVWLKELSNIEISAYLATGEPLDKAGAYGIQGLAALLVKRVEGCYFNVVGLPLNLLYELMTNMQLPIWLNGKDNNHAK